MIDTPTDIRSTIMILLTLFVLLVLFAYWDWRLDKRILGWLNERKQARQKQWQRIAELDRRADELRRQISEAKRCNDDIHTTGYTSDDSSASAA